MKFYLHITQLPIYPSSSEQVYFCIEKINVGDGGINALR